jgi:hypothetical protein
VLGACVIVCLVWVTLCAWCACQDCRIQVAESHPVLLVQEMVSQLFWKAPV